MISVCRPKIIMESATVASDKGSTTLHLGAQRVSAGP